jgi:TetR/AcrR family transcriptional regulator
MADPRDDERRTNSTQRKDKPNRTEQSLETRRRLLEVSLRLFVHKGYAGTTVRDVAEKAGVSVGLMFHYFPSKQAILEEHGRALRDGIGAVAKQLEIGTQPLQTFAAIAGMILESLRDEHTRNLFLLANQVLLLESIPTSVKQMVSTTSSIEASVPLIVSGQGRKEIKQGDPLALAVAFWGALQGIAEVLVWYPTPSIPSTDDVLDILRAKAIASIPSAK